MSYYVEINCIHKIRAKTKSSYCGIQNPKLMPFKYLLYHRIPLRRLYFAKILLSV
nr:MAG TPA: hypothetical protein [Bacteriophage sp.]